MSSIQATLAALKASGRKALIPYVTAGDPYADLTPSIMQALAEGAAAGFRSEDEARLDQFAQRYQQHIQAEEGTAYPCAQALLGQGELHAMGLEMAARRRVG